MDSDFVDFLLDDSHIYDLKQRQVCNIEDVQFSSQDFDVDFDETVEAENVAEPRKEPLDPVAFDVTFEISEDDLIQLEATQKPPNDTEHTKSLFQELEAQKRLIMSKEGEITILRQRLHQLDCEKMTFAQKIAELSEQNAAEARNIHDKYRKEIEKLKAEIKFKEQELSIMNRPRKQPRNTTANAVVESKAPATTAAPVLIPPAKPEVSALELFYSACQEVDARVWDFSKIGHFEVIDIMKAREVSKHAIVQTNSLSSGVTEMLEYAIKLRQPRLMIYTFLVVQILADVYGDRLFDEERTTQIYNLLLKVILERVLLKGIPKEVIRSFFVILNVILFRCEWKLPNEFSRLIKSGFFQWILRHQDFTAAEMFLLCQSLHSISMDVSAVSAVFLQADTDSVGSAAILDLLQSRTRTLLKTLLKESHEECLLQADCLVSLLLSFVHRRLGPFTLWLPTDLFKSLVEWTITTVARASETHESVRVLMAKEMLLTTFLSGVLSIWSTTSLAPTLKILRMPLAGALKLVMSMATPFAGLELIEIASKLFKLIEREVADDLKSLYETGQLAAKT